MKKSTLALAVAAALTGFGSLAYADTTLYGSARVSVDYNDPDSNNFDHTSPDASWDVYNNASRLGVRGEEDLGGDETPGFQPEHRHGDDHAGIQRPPVLPQVPEPVVHARLPFRAAAEARGGLLDEGRGKHRAGRHGNESDDRRRGDERRRLAVPAAPPARRGTGSRRRWAP